jgi:hypothetical protein
MSQMTPSEIDFLSRAVTLLEKPGFLLRMAHVIGEPIEMLQNRLPDKVKLWIAQATEKSLEKALAVALKTIPKDHTKAIDFKSMDDEARKKKRWHTAGAAISGTVGGFFGAAAIPIELPITTTLMLRSILEISQSYGADLKDPRTALECLYVFTLGSANPRTNATDTAYYTTRLGLAQMVHSASRFIGNQAADRVLHALEKGTAPILIKFITNVAARFELAVSEKLLAEAIPIIGAIGGGFVNTAFLNYYNDVARCHFGIRQLEQQYGEDEVKKTYVKLLRG